jgi:hypothetical protein
MLTRMIESRKSHKGLEPQKPTKERLYAWKKNGERMAAR